MVENAKILRHADVNQESGLVRKLMLARQGLLGFTPKLYMLADKFAYLSGELDEELGLTSENMGKKRYPEHPFMPRPAVWHHELMRVVRKGRRETGSFNPETLEIWEKELLCLGEAFDKNYIDADNGMWQRMFRILMVLKRGIQLPPADLSFHNQVVSAIPNSIKQTYSLV